MAWKNIISLLVVVAMMMLCCRVSRSDDQARGFRADMMRLHTLSTTHQSPVTALDGTISRLKTIQTSIASQVSGKASAATHNGGELAMTMGIGTPPKKVVAMVDTASDLIWTQCLPCEDCYNQPDPFFDPSASSSHSDVFCPNTICTSLPNLACTPRCEYEVNSESDINMYGTLSSDKFTLSDIHGKHQSLSGIVFGCSSEADNSNGALSKVDGVVGLGRGNLSLISQIGSAFQYKFSYCITSNSSSPASSLFFGNAAELGATGVMSTPFINNLVKPELNSLYYLSVEGISVGNTSVNITEGTFDIEADGSGGFIIDSGTTLTVLPSAALNAVADVLDSVIGLPREEGPFTVCYQRPSSTISLPNMTFQMGMGADYVIQGVYNFAFVQPQNLLCLMMEGAELGSAPYVLGIFQQENYHIQYDNAKQTLSFAPASCADLSGTLSTPNGGPQSIMPRRLLSLTFIPLFLVLSISMLV